MNSKTFSFEALPKNVAELKVLPEFRLSSPFEAAALTVVCLCRYAIDVDSGIEMLNAIKGPQPLSAYDLRFLKDRFMDKDYVPRSFIEGTSPANNYTPSVPYKITVFENSYSYAEDGYAKLFVNSSGADNERSITLRQKGDMWFLWEQALLSGIRVPAKDDAWA